MPGEYAHAMRIVKPPEQSARGFESVEPRARDMAPGHCLAKLLNRLVVRFV